jgi:hypothetical protein
MNGQPKAAEPLGQYGHHPVGIFFQLKANNKVISKTNQKATPLHPDFNLFYKPLIQHMMQEYVS